MNAYWPARFFSVAASAPGQQSSFSLHPLIFLTFSLLLDANLRPAAVFPQMLLSAVLIPAEAGGFVAHNPETGTTSQGESVPEALANLREATELYLEEFPLSSPSGQPLLTTFEVAVPAHA